MRIANFAIKMALLHCFHPLLNNGSSQKHKIWQQVCLDEFLHKVNVSGSKRRGLGSRDPISEI